MTLNDVVNDIIFEDKKQTLTLSYNIDVFVQEFKEPEEDEEQTDPAIEQGEADVPAAIDPVNSTEQTTQENFDEQGNMLNEEIYKQKHSGVVKVSKEEAMNIQTINDILDFLTDKNHTGNKAPTLVEKVLDVKKTETGGKILSKTIKEILLILIGAQGNPEELEEVVNKGDKVLVEIKYGNGKDNIGFKVNKNAGTLTYSTVMIKDDQAMAARFDQSIVNKQVLYFRNSLT